MSASPAGRTERRINMAKTAGAATVAANDANGYEDVYVPKESNKDDTLFVNANGRHFLVKKGEHVMVPKVVANIIHDREKALMEAQSFIDANEK